MKKAPFERAISNFKKNLKVEVDRILKSADEMNNRVLSDLVDPEPSDIDNLWHEACDILDHRSAADVLKKLEITLNETEVTNGIIQIQRALKIF